MTTSWSLILITLVCCACRGHGANNEGDNRGDDEIKLPEIVEIKVKVIPHSEESRTAHEYDRTIGHKDGYARKSPVDDYDWKNSEKENELGVEEMLLLNSNKMDDGVMSLDPKDDALHGKIGDVIRNDDFEEDIDESKSEMGIWSNPYFRYKSWLFGDDDDDDDGDDNEGEDDDGNGSGDEENVTIEDAASDNIDEHGDSSTTTSSAATTPLPRSSSSSTFRSSGGPHYTPAPPPASSTPRRSRAYSARVSQNQQNNMLTNQYSNTLNVSQRHPPTKHYSYHHQHYKTCENCMVRTNQQECLIYGSRIQDIESRLSRLHSLLVYGCPKTYKGDQLCCHGNNEDVTAFLTDLSAKLQNWERLARSQCDKCPEDCKWSPWGPWTDCPFVCQRGHRRSRSREMEGPFHGGRPCTRRANDETQIEDCPTPIAYPRQWTNWSSWSACSTTCGGVKTKSRLCQEGDRPCSTPCHGDCQQTQACGNMDDCCVEAFWGTWTEWTNCPKMGTSFGVQSRRHTVLKFRNRTCAALDLNKPICPRQCYGVGSEVSECCDPDMWTHWSAWTECSNAGGSRARKRVRPNVLNVPVHLLDHDGNPCGDGCRNRTRSCLPGNCHGSSCHGKRSDILKCFIADCCVIADWTSWTAWTSCDQSSCQTRSRHCSPPPPTMTAPDNYRPSPPVCRKVGCHDKDPEIETKDCCVEDTWGLWSLWGGCDVTCGAGTRSRTRECHVSASKSCGRPCHGLTTEKLPCRQQPCCESKWSPWETWSECSVTCDSGTGLMSRSRTCIKSPTTCVFPTPCYGSDFDRRACKETKPCCVDGDWASWGQWSQCDVTCGSGNQSRRRLCNNPAPNHCGRQCQGQSTSAKRCHRSNCCIDGDWALWGQWSQCDVTCGSGNQSRRRLCNNPAPNHCGRRCQGQSTSTNPCHRSNCCDPGHWGTWSSWADCHCRQGTSTGTTYRSRVFTSTSSRILCASRRPIKESKNCQCCTESCKGMPDGLYPARCYQSCEHFLLCCQGEVYGNARRCPRGDKFHPRCKTCVQTLTCPTHHTPCLPNPVTPLGVQCPGCVENCKGKQEGHYASTCVKDCKTFYRCCNEALTSGGTICDEGLFYDSRKGCCTWRRPSTCIPGVGDSYKGVHDPRADTHACVTKSSSNSANKG